MQLNPDNYDESGKKIKQLPNNFDEYNTNYRYKN